jgi:TonB family protein
MTFMKFSLIMLTTLLIFGCEGKKKIDVFGWSWTEVKAAAAPAEVKLSVDTYARAFLNPEGKVLLYVVAREPQVGWGLGHGNELVSYDLEHNLKLPLGKLGRSTDVTVIQLGEELKNAIIKTVDTDGNGDIDERDANQLYITAPFGLDDEPVSPIAKDTLGVWQDPMFQWVVFMVSDDWPGRKKKKKETIDPTPVVYAWDPETRLTAQLAKCDRFYGFTPDGQQFGCLVPGQEEKADGMQVAVYKRGSKQPLKTVTLPVTKKDQVALPGPGRFVYSKWERGESGETSVLWLRAGGKDRRVTNPSVSSTLLFVLKDGAVVFLSRSVDSVDDAVLVRVLGPDGKEVRTVFRTKGSDIDSVTLAPNGTVLAFLKRLPAQNLIEGEVGRAKVLVAGLTGPAAPAAPTQKVADEHIDSLGAAILSGLREKTKAAPAVDVPSISVDIRKKVAYIPLRSGALEGKGTPDEQLVAKARELKGAIVPTLRPLQYDGILFSPDLKDAHVVIRFEPRFGEYFTYLTAYGEEVSVREEYDLFIEDLAFRKMPGCKDPRLVQLHCSGWLTSDGKVKGQKVNVNCKAVPLNPIQIMREDVETVEMPQVGSEAVGFENIVDKVDPRRSNRYSYSLEISVDGKPVPFYDAGWAAASRAWIDLVRGLKDLLPAALLPYSGRTEYMQLLSRWRPDTVVSRESHLEVHLFLDPAGTLPPIEDTAAWDGLAQSVMDRVTEHVKTFDEGREKDVRVNLYSGNDAIVEVWHKSPQELLEEAMMDPAWQPPTPEELEAAKAKKKKGGPKTKEDEIMAALTEETEDEEDLTSHLPPEKLGLPKAMLDKAEVQKVVASHMQEVKYCYDKEAAGGGLGSGQITVRFVIGPSGKVEGATVVSDTLKSGPVQACVVKAAGRWKFPKPAGEGSVTVNYPFTFSAGK